jgi:hypothetical protein
MVQKANSVGSKYREDGDGDWGSEDWKESC